MIIGNILKEALELEASDIILAPGNYPSTKIDWEVQFLRDYGRLSKDDLNRDILSIMSDGQKKKFAEDLELDFSIELQGYGRFRANAFVQKDGYSIVFRAIKSDIPRFEDLGLPGTILNFASKKNGLVLVTGSVWSGKSTTLASIVNHINSNQNKHIITIEDPVEFIHDSYKSLIEQREVWANTKSFDNGLKYALRQASDVIMLWEMRDIETFRLALRAAETWNLVLATLHTSGAARTISRIIDMFPPDEKDQIRSQIETGKEEWMLTMKKSLEILYGKWIISEETFNRHMKK